MQLATEKAAILQQLQAERAALEARSEQIENQFEANELQLDTLRTQRATELGDLGKLFGVLQQTAGELQASFDASIISAQFPGRVEMLDQLSKKVNQSNDLVTVEEVEGVWQALLNEMVQQGKSATFTAPVATSSGEQSEIQVTRVGVFNLVGDSKFLVHGKGGVAELPRQPGGRYLSQVNDFQSAAPGSAINFSIDPTRGTLLEAAVESPSLWERMNQGGTVGYILIVVGIISVLIAIYKILSLMGISSAVNKQAKNLDNTSDKNPLGRVLRAAEGIPIEDTEALELKLSEAIMKETPKLNSWLMFLKVVAAVAPLGGLLGTVTGMITTFQAITLFGAGDPRLMAGGISTALVTTVLGLCVAIPMVLLHTAAASKAKRVEEILEEQSAGMVARKLTA